MHHALFTNVKPDMIRSMLPTSFCASCESQTEPGAGSTRGEEWNRNSISFCISRSAKVIKVILLYVGIPLPGKEAASPYVYIIFRKMCECIISQSEATVFSLPAQSFSHTHSFTHTHIHTRTNKHTHHTQKDKHKHTQTHACTHSFYLSLKHKNSLELTLYHANWLLYLFMKLLRLQVSA